MNMNTITEIWPMVGTAVEVSRVISENPSILYGSAFAVLGSVAVARHMMSQDKRSLHGDARFANARELKKAGLFRSAGIPVGTYKGRVLRHKSDRHLCLIAPSRSLKGVAVVTPTVLVHQGSLIANDIKGELRRQSSMYRQKHGQKVWVFSPFVAGGHGYNPLFYVSTDPMKRVDSLLEIAHVLYPSAGAGAGPWVAKARELFCGIALLALETDSIPSTIGEVLRQSGGQGMPLKDRLQAHIWERNYTRHEEQNEKGETVVSYIPRKAPFTGVQPLSDACVRYLENFIGITGETTDGFVVNMQEALGLWESEYVDAATSRNEFDLSTFRDEPQSLYIEVPPKKLKQAGVLLNLMWSQALNLNTDEMPTDEEHKIPLLLVLDEFAALGYLQPLEHGIGHVASYGIRMLFAFQSKGQIAKPVSEGGYGAGGAKNLIDNCDTIFFQPEPDDSVAIAALLGDTTVKSQSTKLGFGNSGEGSESDHRRELMKPQELRAIGQDTAILSFKDMKHAAKVKKIIWYQNAYFRNRLWKISPMLAGNKNPSEDDISAAVGELSIVVPTIDEKKWLADKAARTAAALTSVVVATKPAEPPPEPVKRPATVSDVALGTLDLAGVGGKIPTIKKPLTDKAAASLVDAYMGFQLEDDEGDAGGITAIEMAEVIDTDTGEVFTPELSTLVNIALLDNATPITPITLIKPITPAKETVDA